MKHIIILIHGIRTPADWAEMVKDKLERLDTVDEVVLAGYEFFDVLSFLIPGSQRKRPAREVSRVYDRVIHTHAPCEVSVLAHSFGTYSLARVLKMRPEIRFKHLVLCGSIISKRMLNWAEHKHKFSGSIINEVGMKDLWPIFATTVTTGYGPTGSRGFRFDMFPDRFHNLGHSDFFETAFVNKYWVSFFNNSDHVDGVKRENYAWWKEALCVVRLWVVFTALIALATVIFISNNLDYPDPVISDPCVPITDESPLECIMKE